nr:GATA transcription factor 5 [Ipomoea batatas]GMD54831.1 GATA transcription factor 5 [Ipomoea batatas]
MLYPTSHHSHFSPLSSLSLLPPPPPSSLQAVMECVELGAIKSFFRPQAALKMTHQQGYLENEFAAACNVTLVSVSPQKGEREAEAVSFPVTDDFASVPGSELSVPTDDLDNLEWLSHFVEESFSDEYSLTCPAGKLLPLPSDKNNHLSRSETPVQGKPSFISPVQTKARTKRARTGVRVWPLIGKPLAKKPNKPGMHSAQQSRRCSHCGVQKTPQWRAGPLGAKTLCNACGVRFKSGRLLPEYRPACSPTFSRELHSNNHRKVLEMRRKKEAETGPGLGSPVQSF